MFTQLSLPDRKYKEVVVASGGPTGSTAVIPTAEDALIQQQCFLPGEDHAFVQTAADVFERLGIRGLGEDVMAFIDRASGTPSDTQVEGVSGHAQVAAWHRAKLLDVGVPYAKVLIKLAVVETDAEGNTVTKEKEEVRKVDVDECLSALSPDDDKKNVPVHPVLQESGEQITQYCQGSIDISLLHAAVEHVLAMATRLTEENAGAVASYRQSEEGKTPIVVQCRATQAFKKNSLVLVPGGGTIRMHFNRTNNDEDGDDEPASYPPKKKQKTQKTIHTSMLDLVEGGFIQEAAKDKRATSKTSPVEARKRNFDIQSPFLRSTKAKKMVTLNPFGSVLRCPNAKRTHNMAMDTVFVPVSHIKITAVKDSPVETHVELPILRNVQDIKAGDVLTIPWKPAEGDES